MKKKGIFSVLTVFAGGVTGGLVFLAAIQAHDRVLFSGNINFTVFFIMMIFSGAVNYFLWQFFSAYFAGIFRSDPEKEMIETGFIFSLPALPILIMPFFFLFYTKLAAVQLKVVG